MRETRCTVWCLGLLTALATVAQAQGLVDLAARDGPAHSAGGGGSSVRRSADRGRLDLEISPNLQAIVGEPPHEAITLGASARWNPVCGRFDLKADFAALVGKEAREEYLKGILTSLTNELVGSGTELFCQSMPTACSLLMNGNLAANLKLLYTSDLCRSVEDAVMSGAKRGRAEAVLACIDRKRQEGKTQDQAEKACLSENMEIRGFDGRVVGELDLNEEIRRYLTFSKGGSELLDGLTEGRKIAPQTVVSDPKPNAIAERYDKLREDYTTKWKKALETARGGSAQGLSEEDLNALVPAGAPIVTRLELVLLAKRNELELRALVASVAAAGAFLALTREMNEVERKIEALRTTPALENSEENAAYLEGLVRRLRSERERLIRLWGDEARLAGVLAAGHAAGEAEVVRSRIDGMRRAALEAASKNIRVGTRPWGTPESVPPAPAPGSRPKSSATRGSDCGACGLEYSIGASEGRP